MSFESSQKVKQPVDACVKGTELTAPDQPQWEVNTGHSPK